MLMKHYVELYEWFWNIKNTQNHELWDSIVELYNSRVNGSVAESFFCFVFLSAQENENINFTNKKINRFRNKFGMTRKPTVRLNLFQHLLLLDSETSSEKRYTGLPQIYFVNFRNDVKWNIANIM